jgi:hypothetical protein
MHGKYIIFERKGLQYPVLFPNHYVQHKEIQTCDKVVSAGFFAINEGDVFVSGNSVSLGVNSRKEDAELIKKQLTS